MRKNGVVTGIPNDKNKLVVQKSNPLFDLWKSDLTLSEFKILDLYLSRIDSRNPKNRVVLLEKGEVEACLGVEKINIADLKRRLKHLMTIIDIDLGPNEFELVNLFEWAKAKKSDDGLWEVRLECTQKARELFFNIEQLGYIKYRLNAVIGLKSRYSYVLYLYLEKQRKMSLEWQIRLDDLKVLLGCEKESTYAEFKYFNKFVLKKASEEINEQTDCHFTYEPIRRGRKVAFIQFTLKKRSEKPHKIVENADFEVLDGQIGIDEIFVFEYDKGLNDRYNLCSGFEDPAFDGFSLEELAVLKELGSTLPTEWERERAYELLQDGLIAGQTCISDCLKIRVLQVRANKRVKNHYNYLVKMIQSELKNRQI